MHITGLNQPDYPVSDEVTNSNLSNNKFFSFFKYNTANAPETTEMKQRTLTHDWKCLCMLSQSDSKPKSAVQGFSEEYMS